MAFSDKYKGGYASFLIQLAWVVEIIAVLIGLTISVVVSMSANESYSNQQAPNLLSNSASILVAGLPFLLVAAVELCKIPLTFAFMAVKNIFWRSLFLFFVAFLCVITFETMLNGFERNFANLNFSIDTRKNNIENVEAEIALLERRKERIQTFTEDDLAGELDEMQRDINQQYRASVNRLDSQTKTLLTGIDYSVLDELEAEIQTLTERRDTYDESWDQERQQIENRFSVLLLDNLSDSRNEKGRLLNELEELKQEMDTEVANANFLTRSAVENKYRDLIAGKNRQIDQVTSSYLGGDAIAKQATMEEQLRQQLAFASRKYQGRINDVNRLIEERKQEINQIEQENSRIEEETLGSADTNRLNFMAIKMSRESELESYRDKRQAELGVIRTRTDTIDEQVFLLKNDQRNIQSEINRMASQNQVYRLAMYVYGAESPSEVSRSMVGIVALIWFGSLALIASVTGVMLSLAGFYLRRELMAEALRKEEQEKADRALKEAVTKAAIDVHTEEAEISESEFTEGDEKKSTEVA